MASRALVATTAVTAAVCALTVWFWRRQSHSCSGRRHQLRAPSWVQRSETRCRSESAPELSSPPVAARSSPPKLIRARSNPGGGDQEEHGRLKREVLPAVLEAPAEKSPPKPIDSPLTKLSMEYVSVKLLGRGSYGAAYLMRRERDGDLCVCKHVTAVREQDCDVSLLEAIPSEVRILASLDHPHVIQYLAVDTYPSIDDEALVHLWMEYAPGGSLDTAIQAQAKLSRGGFATGRVATWAIQLADALNHVHSRRILHRDLKAANIFLTHSGDVKLGDFGVARAFAAQTIGRSQSALTAVGTPYYMAPELIKSEEYGAPSDIWSLGVVLYELLTLKRPFDAANLGAVILSIADGRYDEAALAQCAHNPRLCALASRAGLLHPEPKQRLTIEGLRIKILEWLWSDDAADEDADGVADRLMSSPRHLSHRSPASRGTLGRQRVAEASGVGGVRARRDSLVDLIWAGGEPESGTAEAATVAVLLAKRRSSAAVKLDAPLDAQLGSGALDTRLVNFEDDLADESSVEGHTEDHNVDGAMSGRGRARAPTVFEEAPAWAREELVGALTEAGRIEWRELAFGDRIGSGGFGSVHKATWSTSNAVATKAGGALTVAVKTMISTSAVHEMCKEATLLCTARHAKVVSVFGLSVSPDASLCLVMEYLPGGSLFDLLHPKGVDFCEDGTHGSFTVLLEGLRLVRLMQDCAQGLAFLHGRGIVHRDLKSMNLLLDAERAHLKVCDFGLSRSALLTAKMTRVGSIQWAAPEVLLGVAYGPRADVWSFGVVLWELCTGAIPYSGIPRPKLARMVALDGMRLPIPRVSPHRCPTQLVRLIGVCFQEERARPQFHQIINILDACEDGLRKGSPGGVS